MKKFIFLMLIALTCLCLSGISHAQDEELAPGFDACMDKAETTSELVACADSGFEHWSAILKENYEQAKECPYDNEEQCAEYQSNLAKSMAAWEAYRDAMVNHLGSNGGTINRVNVSMFLLETTRSQALLLQQ